MKRERGRRVEDRLQNVTLLTEGGHDMTVTNPVIGDFSLDEAVPETKPVVHRCFPEEDCYDCVKWRLLRHIYTEMKAMFSCRFCYGFQHCFVKSKDTKKVRVSVGFRWWKAMDLSFRHKCWKWIQWASKNGKTYIINTRQGGVIQVRDFHECYSFSPVSMCVIMLMLLMLMLRY